MLIGGYPNLELLEYIAREACQKTNPEKYKELDFHADVFLQGWGSTALGFGGIGGQAMSEAYTTVFVDDLLGVCVVFFGRGLAYIVQEPKEPFFEDLKNRDMADVAMARRKY